MLNEIVKIEDENLPVPVEYSNTSTVRWYRDVPNSRDFLRTHERLVISPAAGENRRVQNHSGITYPIQESENCEN